MKYMLKNIFIFFSIIILFINCMIGCTDNNISTNINNYNKIVEDLKYETDEYSNKNKNDNIIIIESAKINSVLSEEKSNEKLEKKIIEELNLTHTQAEETKYYYNYVDLNGDGKEEIFVELAGPYTSGSNGNTAFIFKENNGELEKINNFISVSNPVIISNEKSNGWNDIIFEYSASKTPPKYIALKYDGNKYSDISTAEEIKDLNSISGISIICNDMTIDNMNELYLEK